MLLVGSSGAEVTSLQTQINTYLTNARQGGRSGVPANLSVDGRFGNMTKTALKFLTGKETTTLGSFTSEVVGQVMSGVYNSNNTNVPGSGVYQTPVPTCTFNAFEPSTWGCPN